MAGLDYEFGPTPEVFRALHAHPGYGGPLGVVELDRHYHTTGTPGWDTHVIRSPHYPIGIEVTGPPDGQPIICLAGTPGSRKGPKPAPDEYPEDALVIWPDRPGYGITNFYLTMPQVLRAILQYFNLRNRPVAIVAKSGGMTSALLAAEETPEIACGGFIVPVSPKEGRDAWTSGMNDFNQRVLSLDFGRDGVPNPFGDPQKIRNVLSELERIRQTTKRLADGNSVPENKEAGVTRNTAKAHAAGLQYGSDGRFLDYGLATQYMPDWKRIRSRGPFKIWAASEDVHTPLAIHGAYVAKKLGGAALEIVEGDHYRSNDLTVKAVAWCVQQLKAIS